MIDPHLLMPPFRPLLDEERLNELGPGSPNLPQRAALEEIQRELLASTPGSAQEGARACLAGLWLYHDFFEEAHALSQDLPTMEGSYWHAILHRREPDAANAAYWFRRVGAHPLFEKLAQEAASLGLRRHQQGWSPYEFIDLCEQHRGTGSAQERLLRQVQKREWELLFGWCVRAYRQDADPAGS